MLKVTTPVVVLLAPFAGCFNEPVRLFAGERTHHVGSHSRHVNQFGDVARHET